MNLNAISASDLANKIYVISEKTAKVAVEYLGRAYEWLSVNIPVAMKAAYDLSQKAIIAAQPHLATIGKWAVDNQDNLKSYSIGAAVGFTLAYLIYARAKKTA